MNETPRKPPRFQFGLPSLFVATTIFAFLAAAAVAGFRERAHLRDVVWYAREAIEDARDWLSR